MVSMCFDQVADLICSDSREALNVLEIGCGGGHTLERIRYKKPGIHIYGTEKNEIVAKANQIRFSCIHADVETDILPFENYYFDYVIVNETFEPLNNYNLAINNIRRFCKGEHTPVLKLSSSNQK